MSDATEALSLARRLRRAERDLNAARAELSRLRKAIDRAPCPVGPCCQTGRPAQASRGCERCWKEQALFPRKALRKGHG